MRAGNFLQLRRKIKSQKSKVSGVSSRPKKGPCLDKTSRGPPLPPSLVPGEFHFIYMPMPHPSTVYIHSPILPLEFSHSKKEFFRGIREPNNLRFFSPSSSLSSLPILSERELVMSL